MKFKFLNSNYDKETGISTVTISTKYGKFTGEARLNPEDKEYESTFYGCYIAENRAIINALKARMNKLVIEVTAYEEYQCACMNANYTNQKSRESIILHKFIVGKYKEIFEIKKQIKAIKQSIDIGAKERIKLIKREFNKKDNLN